MRYFLLVGMVLLSLTCVAAIYMQKDANGNISYSDVQTSNATRLDLPPAPTTAFAPATQPPNKSATKDKATAKAGDATTDDHQEYTAFFITLPVEQQTYQNQRDIAVELSTTPALQKGDTIQLYVDGSKVGPATATTHFQVNQIPRGTHQVSATLLDVNKATLKQAPTVNFFVHYAALGGAVQ